MKNILHNKIPIHINEMSMVSFDLLGPINLYHGKNKTLHINLSIV